VDKHRRHFLKASAATTLTVALNKLALANDNKTVTQSDKDAAQDIIVQMSDAGHSDFVLIDKKTSKLYVIQSGNIHFETPVIIGRVKDRKSLTPSGIFSLINVFQGATEPKMVFHQDRTGAYLLHGIVSGREYALKIDSITAKQLSNGCVNIPDIILPFILGFARQHSENDPKGLATPLVITDEVYNSTKFSKALKSFVPFKYNPD